MGGFTKFDNAFLEALVMARLTQREWALIVHMQRETEGRQGRAYVVSPAQVAKVTSLPRQVVSDTLASLSTRSMVVQVEGGWMVQHDPSRWVSQNVTSQNVTPTVTNRDTQTSQNVTPCTPKTASSAEVEMAKESSKEKRKSPLTPLGEGEVEQKWIAETFGISSEEEVDSLNEKTGQALRRYLAHPATFRARALHALSKTTEPIYKPFRFVMSLLNNPVDLPPLPDSNIVDFEKPHEWAHKPWAVLYKPKEFKGREHQEVLGLGDIVDRFGTGNFHETDRIYRAKGFEAAMDYIWDHHPRNGYHKNARAQ